MKEHYYYLLDPEVAMVQLFHATDREALKQIVFDGTEYWLLPPRALTARERRLLHEAGRPPIPVPEDGKVYVGPAIEPCLYCGKAGVPIGLLGSFSLPLYEPRGHTCQSCGKTVILLD